MTRRLFTYLSASRAWVMVAMILLLGAKAIDVVVPARLGAMVQGILAGEYATDPGTVLQAVVRGIIVVLVLVGVGYLFDSLVVLLMNRIGQTGVYTLRRQVFDHLQQLHMAYFDEQRVGQLVGRTITDVERIEKGLSEGLVAGVANLVLILGIVIGMYVIDWHLALMITILLPLLYLLAEWFRREQNTAFAQARAILGRLNVFVQEHLTGTRVLRRFQVKASEREEFEGHNHAFRNANVRTIHNYATLFAGVDWIHSFFLILIFVGLIEYGLLGREFQAGIFFTFSLYLLTFFRPVIDIIEHYNTLQEALAASTRVFELLDVSPKIRSEGKARIGVIETVAFDHVWFAYRGDQWALTDLSLHVQAGQSIAIVGETGSGKTTLSNLLVRFYDPQKGSILINGRDLREYPLMELRKHLGIVLQDPVIFSGTLRDNLSLFDPSIPDEELIQALHYVEAWPLVERLPGQLQAQLHEQGKGLSAGERQLLSLARAIAQKRELLILDEATANIDPLTEQLIQKALTKILRDKTTLVIAHRLSTIRQASQIVVLDRGRLVEMGTHDELRLKKGFYEKLYRLQFI